MEAGQLTGPRFVPATWGLLPAFVVSPAVRLADASMPLAGFVVKWAEANVGETVGVVCGYRT